MVKKIDISTPKYPDTYALVDDDDYERLTAFGKWSCKAAGGLMYAARGGAKGYEPLTLMHRVIVGAEKNEEVDHKNRNGLDNRKLNLRKCSRTENACNRGVHSNSKSGYKGVYYSCNRRGKKKYRAQIVVNMKQVFLGWHETAEEAAEAYDEAARKYHGEYALTNKSEKT